MDRKGKQEFPGNSGRGNFKQSFCLQKKNTFVWIFIEPKAKLSIIKFTFFIDEDISVEFLLENKYIVRVDEVYVRSCSRILLETVISFHKP